MWLRGVLTLCCLVLAGAALALWDCAGQVVGDPFGFCPIVDEVALPQPQMFAAAFAGISVVGLAIVWIPYLRFERRRRRALPERILIENIRRIPEPYSDLQAQEGADLVAELTKRIEVVETAFASDAPDSRSLTSEWMWLLHEVNRLHNDGMFPTDDFKVLNTRLLDVAGKPVGSRRTVQTSPT